MDQVRRLWYCISVHFLIWVTIPWFNKSMFLVLRKYTLKFLEIKEHNVSTDLKGSENKCGHVGGRVGVCVRVYI